MRIASVVTEDGDLLRLRQDVAERLERLAKVQYADAVRYRERMKPFLKGRLKQETIYV